MVLGSETSLEPRYNNCHTEFGPVRDRQKILLQRRSGSDQIVVSQRVYAHQRKRTLSRTVSLCSVVMWI